MKEFLLSLLLLFTGTSMETLPVQHEGRICPALHLQDRPLSEWKCLPGPSEWLSLSALHEEENPTLYSDALFHSLQRAQTQEEMSKLLWEGYRSLAGTPYLQAHSKRKLYPSKLQLTAEVLLAKIPFTLILIIGYLLLFRTTLLLHTLLLVARVWIIGRPPVTSMAETLIYVPWIVALVALLLKRRWVGAIGSAGLLLLFWFSSLSERFETLQPVLDSNYWLGTHVLLVVGSYGLLLLSSLLAHLYLYKPKVELTRAILQTLYIGMGMLIVGTLLGGLWAAESWGRFWDWDPKESWAFISICLYLAIIHARLFGLLSDRRFALLTALAFFSITFTWYGVNYILGAGLHSYGFGEGGQLGYLLGIGGDALLISYLTIRLKHKITQ